MRTGRILLEKLGLALFNGEKMNLKLPKPIWDSCKNYDLVTKSEPRKVLGMSLGHSYKKSCRNWGWWDIMHTSSYYPDFKGICMFCYNWQTPEGKYVNRLEEIALDFYEKDTKKFIRYFKKKIIPDKKKIIKKVFECDFINEKVIEYLDEKESELIREVGLNLV